MVWSSDSVEEVQRILDTDYRDPGLLDSGEEEELLKSDGELDLTNLTGSLLEIVPGPEESGLSTPLPVPETILTSPEAVCKAGNLWFEGKNGACREALVESAGVEAVLLPHDRTSPPAYVALMKATIMAGFRCPIASCMFVTPATKNQVARADTVRDEARAMEAIVGNILFVDQNSIATHWENNHVLPAVSATTKAQCTSRDAGTGLRCSVRLSANVSDVRRHLQKMHSYKATKDSEARISESVASVPKRPPTIKMPESSVRDLFAKGLDRKSVV